METAKEGNSRAETSVPAELVARNQDIAGLSVVWWGKGVWTCCENIRRFWMSSRDKSFAVHRIARSCGRRVARRKPREVFYCQYCALPSNNQWDMLNSFCTSLLLGGRWKKTFSKSITTTGTEYAPIFRRKILPNSYHHNWSRHTISILFLVGLLFYVEMSRSNERKNNEYCQGPFSWWHFPFHLVGLRRASTAKEHISRHDA